MPAESTQAVTVHSGIQTIIINTLATRQIRAMFSSSHCAVLASLNDKGISLYEQQNI